MGKATAERPSLFLFVMDLVRGTTTEQESLTGDAVRRLAAEADLETDISLLYDHISDLHDQIAKLREEHALEREHDRGVREQARRELLAARDQIKRALEWA